MVRDRECYGSVPSTAQRGATTGRPGTRMNASASLPPADRQRLRAAGSITGAGACHVLSELHQSGGAKIRLPRSGRQGLSAVLLNTAGGLTGGDRIDWSASADRGARVVVASAASEKVYRTHGPDAEQNTTLHVGPDARLDWLPQETILFDRSRLRRTLTATLSPDACLLVVEALVLGRRASGETLRTAAVRDDWRIHRDGRLLHAESLRIDTDAWQALAQGTGTLHGIGAIATILWCAPDRRESLRSLAAELHASLDARRTSVDDLGVRRLGGASALEGRVVVRLAASSGFELRKMLLPSLSRLQGDAPLPRVWHV